jgi:uncharacterized membrane protein YbhN (UPF0104 family)
MRRDPNEERASRMNGVLKYLSGMMAVLYILLGTAILLTHNNENFEETYRNLGSYPWRWIGVALLVYGLFRSYSVYNRYFRNEE